MGSTSFSRHITSSSRPKSGDPSLSPNGNHVFMLNAAGIEFDEKDLL
jgi:hypothetical protein